MKKILVAIVVVLIAIQLIPVDLSNPASVPEDDFFYINEAPAEVQSLVHSACYDCHSNETVYPWYAKIAPVNFWLKNHINEGREELNFSNWARYVALNKANKKLDECAEKTQNKKMPLSSYTWLHEEARLTDAQRAALVKYFSDLMKKQN
ncbi:heme-binding domain-containing protein [Ornithobacterium rhinotracheale]|uniref:Haem-binding domain-containing protein n=1 Tax=Ornithobacterium rhinotracheale (strain ATCC 51463 / DSM 15997 / CCUG 23171 / CIP 104009 / LMG 9086) TaxID=867902 RepID=I4A007_ORNRL|nr:heme-binding domain-containing protein [Ornithobacterium rhinotracheale]AFL97291.1 hypothetical protein Ornrh_1103 [Ornithobacterium rhinotracheale DSM 15997]AIP99351.1 cytochrome C [Ornithobacterium rhinotracheale ORT-UMN 88]KGB67167.1 cytochrome C [Ornithobacterium rhinotracheale H06-030791]MBN3663023.1 cytochrome C [Ornithobacterium rhinotracheale]MCK0194182.1 heme-binding domain-containing protein [Ornithobacterium rhinotracheale]